jgi:EAL domain-containing protein (putative c-di-GMP-specific phosphodiesterase class I)/GGDEF domain-containing protein
MISAPKPKNEQARLEVLRSLRLLDTPAEAFYDSITRLAAQLFGVRSALVTFVEDERQWFKSRFAFGCEQTPRAVSFCGHAILADEPTIVLDALEDPRFNDNPLVTSSPGIRFYAGAPLSLENGVALGTLCLIDDQPRSQFGAHDQAILVALAKLTSERLRMLSSLAYLDDVTGLPNLARFNIDVPAFTSDDADPNGGFTYAVMLDICPLEYINRMVVALGAQTTQQAALATTDRLRSVIPNEMTLYRIGYARYAFLTRGGLEDACLIATRCVLTHSAPLFLNNAVEVEVAPSAGVVELITPVDPGLLMGNLIAAAEEARATNAAVMLYDLKMKQRRERAFTILNSLKAALTDVGQLHLLYQPRVRLTDGHCVGAEALLRWDHPQLGCISPSEFIPIIEQTALISKLTDWVLDTALRQISQWSEQFPLLKVSVNIAAADLSRPDLIERVIGGLETHGVPGAKLELEVTEGALVQNSQQAAWTLNRLRNFGVSIAIDDFGSGYSNLAQLNNLPADILKIDQTLIRAITTSSKDAIIVRSTIRLAHELGYTVVAEGVEDSEIYTLLANNACEEAQGFYIARPLDSWKFEKWLIKHNQLQSHTPSGVDRLI